MVFEQHTAPRSWVDRFTPLLLAVIILVGFALRVWNLQYDGGMNGHPDERSNTCSIAPSIALPTSWDQFMDPKQSPLNPLWNIERQERRSYTYGHFPLYVGVAMGELFHVLTPTVSALGAPEWMVQRMERANTACEGVAIPGRFTIALFDTLTILSGLFAGSAYLWQRCRSVRRRALCLYCSSHPTKPLLCHGPCQHHLYRAGNPRCSQNGAATHAQCRTPHRHRLWTWQSPPSLVHCRSWPPRRGWRACPVA